MTLASVFMRRVLMIAVPTALGAAAIFYAGGLKKLPEPTATTRQPALVRVITVAPIDFIPRVGGYGTVEPVREWRAVARIEGEVLDVAKALAPGNVIPAGTRVFKLDDSDLRLNLATIDAQLVASRIKDGTVGASLALAQSDLALVQEDLKRQEQLNQQGVVTKAALETNRRQELTARIKVTELSSQITLNAAERDVLSTQRASLERAIGFADIHAPYDLRVSDLSADIGQYVNRGQVLLVGEGIDAVDISAQFSIGQIGPLLRLAGNGATVLDLDAEVKLSAPGHSIIWPAKVARMGEAIDARTQSAPVVVRVTDPQGQSVAGERPPLRRNMFVEIELSGPKQKALVVPVEAVQNGTALVISAEGMLERRSVEIGFYSGTLAVVTKGLAVGDKLVVTDPSIAVLGMAVKPLEDDLRKAEITSEALGQTPRAAKPKTGAGAGKADEAVK